MSSWCYWSGDSSVWKAFEDEDAQAISSAVKEKARTVTLKDGRVVDLIHKVMLVPPDSSLPQQHYCAVSDSIDRSVVLKPNVASYQPKAKKPRTGNSASSVPFPVPVPPAPAAAAAAAAAANEEDDESSEEDKPEKKVKFVKKGKGVVDPFALEKEPSVCPLSFFSSSAFDCCITLCVY